MFKFIALLTGGDADAAADVSVERPSLPSASTDPSAAADQRKDKVRKTSNERNITAGVVTQPHHSPQRSPTRKPSSPSFVEGGSTQSSQFGSTDGASKVPPAVKRVGAEDDRHATKQRSVSGPPALDRQRQAGDRGQLLPHDNDCGSSNQTASGIETGNSACIYAGRLIANPHELFDTVESVFLGGGMRRSELQRKVKDSFDKDEWKKQFNLEGFERNGKNLAFFKRGKWTCIHPGCPWNLAASYMSSKNAFEILDGKGPGEAKYNTNLCLEHNHEIQYEIVDGVEEITSPKDLTGDEMEILPKC
ncbi:hypothetical protein THAOC_19024, partial [Thalassiosira oceanica]